MLLYGSCAFAVPFWDLRDLRVFGMFFLGMVQVPKRFVASDQSSAFLHVDGGDAC